MWYKRIAAIAGGVHESRDDALGAGTGRPQRAGDRPITVTGGASFIYDGDGTRVKKTEGGQTILYVNKYYEKNLTTGEVTTYYYLGDRLVAKRTGTTLQYVHEDHLTGTSVVSDNAGAFVSSIKFYPFGSTRSGDVPTDRKFTGQRLDSTGLYYYGARYYDPTIGRFISPDTIVQTSPDVESACHALTVNQALLALDQSQARSLVWQSPADPQALNRYSYALNDPLKYVDPTGYRNWLKMIAGAVLIVFTDLFVAAPITLVGIFVPPAQPVAAAFDTFVVLPINCFGLYLIATGNAEGNSRGQNPAPPATPRPSLPTYSDRVTAPMPYLPTVTLSSRPKSNDAPEPSRNAYQSGARLEIHYESLVIDPFTGLLCDPILGVYIEQLF